MRVLQTKILINNFVGVFLGYAGFLLGRNYGCRQGKSLRNKRPETYEKPVSDVIACRAIEPAFVKDAGIIPRAPQAGLLVALEMAACAFLFACNRCKLVKA